MLAAGLAASNARATLKGLLNRSSALQRTPKGVQGGLGRCDRHGYALRQGGELWLDMALAIHATVAVGTAWWRDE